MLAKSLRKIKIHGVYGMGMVKDYWQLVEDYNTVNDFIMYLANLGTVDLSTWIGRSTQEQIELLKASQNYFGKVRE
jgi:hypothetical protein